MIKKKKNFSSLEKKHIVHLYERTHSWILPIYHRVTEWWRKMTKQCMLYPRYMHIKMYPLYFWNTALACQGFDISDLNKQWYSLTSAATTDAAAATREAGGKGRECCRCNANSFWIISPGMENWLILAEGSRGWVRRWKGGREERLTERESGRVNGAAHNSRPPQKRYMSGKFKPMRAVSPVCIGRA